MTTQSISQHDTLLRRAIRANSLFSGTSGSIFLILAAPISQLLGVTNQMMAASITGIPFFQVLGIILLLYAVQLYWLSNRSTIPLNLALGVITLDIIWVILSAMVIVMDIWSLTTIGVIMVGILADIVLIFALVQSLGLYRLQNRTS